MQGGLDTMGNQKVSRLIFVAGLVVGAACFIYYYAHQLTIAHYDAKAHLLVARRMVDSLEPGYAQMGAHWLPLIHLVYLPFVLIESQYRSGLLPSLISVLSFAVSVWLTYRISYRITGSVSAGAFAAVILMANPNLGYLQSCPLTEPLYMMLLLLGVDSLISWRESDRQDLPWLAATWVSLGALCRYEGWVVVAGVFLLLLYDFLTGYQPRRKVVRAAAVFFSVFIIPAAAHFGYIYHRLGDVFFLRVAQGRPDPYVTFKRPLLSVVYHLGELYQMAALIPLAVAVFGLIIFFSRRKEFRYRAPLLLLWLPSVINIAALYWGLIYRLRYSVLLLPAVAIFGSLAVNSRVAKKRAFLAVLLITMILPWLSWFYEFKLRPGPGAVLLPAAGLILFLIARSKRQYEWMLPLVCVLGMQIPPLASENRQMMAETLEHEFIEPERAQVMEYIGRNYDGTKILIDMGRQAPLVYDSGLNVREFIYNEGGEKLWHRALRNPAGEVGWLCSENGDAISKKLEVDPEWAAGYSLALKTEHFRLYRLKE